MNNTTTQLDQQGSNLVYNVNIPSKPVTTSLPFDVENDLDKYSKIYISRQVDPFRIVSCYEAVERDYIIQGETGSGDKKILFTSSVHNECCECCDQYVIGYFCCGYACCDSILFQMDYERNGYPFYVQGLNLTQGCHCCDTNLGCGKTCQTAGKELYLRETTDAESADIKIGRPKGRTKTNCCCACDKYVDYMTENNLKGQTVKADCCSVCQNTCMHYCCLGFCAQGYDLEISIENENGIKTGNIFIYSGCYSKKVDGKCCYFPRPYFEINMPPDASSEQKFQVIADIIHFDLVNKII